MKHLLVFFIICFWSSLWATTGKYRCILRDDPATTMTIGWHQIDGSTAQVYYDVVDRGTNSAAYAFSQGHSRTVYKRDMNNVFVRLTGLQPNTVYYFIIKDNNSTSARYSFRTSPNVSTERLSFIAGGDSRNNRTPRKNANRMVAKTRCNAVLFGGDMTNGDTNSEWKDWFDDWQLTIAPDGRMTPIVATRGNHEGSNSVIYDLFDTPSSNVYYALTFGGNLFRAYTLNTLQSVSGSQKTWLENDLQANQNVRWKSAQYHHPMRPHVSSKSERNDLVTHWAPLFENYGVDFVVECDAHTVKNTYPIRRSSAAGSDEGFIRDDANGVVYMGEGCWGAPLRSNNDGKAWSRHTGSFNQVKWIFIDQNGIEARTIKIDNATSVGTLSDANRFTIPSGMDVWMPAPGEDVVYIGGAPSNGGAITTTSTVTQGSDDAEEYTNGNVSLTSSDLEMVNDVGLSQNNQVVGLRFSSVNVPAGATVTNAYIQFTCDETSSTSTTVNIRVEDVANAPSFSNNSNNITNRTEWSPSIQWANIPAWNQVGEASAAQRTPNLANLVERVVDKSGWQQGNPIVFVIRGTGQRTAESYDGSAPPRLVITYQNGTGGGTGGGTTITSNLTQGSDDAEEYTNGNVSLTSSDLEMVNDVGLSQNNQVVGLRFSSVNVPAGATITNAYIQFTCDETSSTSTTVNIRVEDAANAPTFSTSSNNITNRNEWTGTVQWANIPAWNQVGEAGAAQRTPNLANLVEHVVGKSGWQQGNSLVFVIRGTGQRTAESYDGSAPAQLVITYQDGNSNGNCTATTMDACESINGWSSANSLTRSGTKQEGLYSIKSIGSGTDDFKKVFSNIDGSNHNVLEFWYYVSDVSQFSSSNQVELGSAGRADQNEYHWNISSGALSNGWNKIQLPFSAAGTTGGTPDLSRLNWFRLYRGKYGSVTSRVDGIKLICDPSKSNGVAVFPAKGNRKESKESHITVVPVDNFTVYPNPARGSFKIFLNEAEEHPVMVQVRDLQGRVVIEGSSNEVVKAFDISHLTQGIYLVTVSNKYGTKTKRLVVQ